MNEKKAKSIRRAARQMAAQLGVPLETQYLIHRNTGVIRVGRCLHGLVRHMKKQVRRGALRFGKRSSLVGASS